MSVAEKLTRDVDILQLLVQTMSELGRDLRDDNGDYEPREKLQDALCEMADQHVDRWAEISDYLKSLYNRKYDCGWQQLVDYIQGKEI